MTLFVSSPLRPTHLTLFKSEYCPTLDPISALFWSAHCPIRASHYLKLPPKYLELGPQPQSAHYSQRPLYSVFSSTLSHKEEAWDLMLLNEKGYSLFDLLIRNCDAPVDKEQLSKVSTQERQVFQHLLLVLNEVLKSKRNKVDELFEIFKKCPQPSHKSDDFITCLVSNSWINPQVRLVIALIHHQISSLDPNAQKIVHRLIEEQLIPNNELERNWSRAATICTIWFLLGSYLILIKP